MKETVNENVSKTISKCAKAQRPRNYSLTLTLQWVSTVVLPSKAQLCWLPHPNAALFKSTKGYSFDFCLQWVKNFCCHQEFVYSSFIIPVQVRSVKLPMHPIMGAQRAQQPNSRGGSALSTCHLHSEIWPQSGSVCLLSSLQYWTCLWYLPSYKEFFFLFKCSIFFHTSIPKLKI